MNAMHLKDAWANDFEEDFPRPFKLFDGTTQSPNFMLDWDDYSYLERNGLIALSKKLMSNYSMCISMPGEEISIQEYIKNGSAWKISWTIEVMNTRKLPENVSSTCPNSTSAQTILT